MPRRKTMRRIRDCLRLYYESEMNQSQISRSLNISRSTVQDYLSRLTLASLSYETSQSLSDSELEERLYPEKTKRIGQFSRPEIDFAYIHKELARTGVTLRLLWEEYKQEQPACHQYSQFCWHYQQWKMTLKVYMRQHHIAGERVFVDYSVMRDLSSKKKCLLRCFYFHQLTDLEIIKPCRGRNHTLRTSQKHTVILGLVTQIVWSSDVFRNVIRNAGTVFRNSERSHE
jgi:predicted DNA-binding protein YlxM (UPF0122 family)